MQLMHVEVQKSTSTTCPRSPARVSGAPPGVLNHRWVLVNSGAVPRSGSDGVLTPGIETPTRSVTGLAEAWLWRSAKRDGGRSEARRFCTALEFSNERVGSTRKAGRLVA